MKVNEQQNFRAVYSQVLKDFYNAREVHTNTWQGVNIENKPEMATFELEDYLLSFPIGTTELGYHRFQIGPNMPWADDHFTLDRISGEPLNPGKTWDKWPWALKADQFRNDDGQFSHSYAERYWPKLAGLTDQGELNGTHFDPAYFTADEPDYAKKVASHNVQALSHGGIRYKYGDLSDVVDLLVRNPLTRNAYLPVWFPEDTGVVDGQRTPCTIGYLFRMRENRLSVFYDIRSCDLYRHFKDDVYLTVRLLIWVLDQCRSKEDKWHSVRPGQFTMHIGSFHLFKNDYKRVLG